MRSSAGEFFIIEIYARKTHATGTLKQSV